VRLPVLGCERQHFVVEIDAERALLAERTVRVQDQAAQALIFPGVELYELDLLLEQRFSRSAVVDQVLLVELAVYARHDVTDDLAIGRVELVESFLVDREKADRVGQRKFGHVLYFRVPLQHERADRGDADDVDEPGL
jgi:hypothetical protein